MPFQTFAEGVGHAIHEIVLFGIAREIHQWQHRQGTDIARKNAGAERVRDTRQIGAYGDQRTSAAAPAATTRN